MKKSKPLRIEVLYLCIVIALGAIGIIVFPPNTAPDEPAHFQCAYIYTDYVFGTMSEDDTLIEMREADIDLFEYPYSPDRASYERYMSDLSNPWAPEDELDTVGTKRFALPMVPFDYLPQALGIFIGRLAGLSFVWMYTLARLLNLIMYAFVTFLAIKETPMGKGIFAVVALFPINIELAASLSYDPFIIAFAFLTIAFFLKLKYGEEKVKTKDIIVFMFALMMLAPTKGVYATFFLLAFLVPRDRLENVFQRRLYYTCFAGFALAGAVMTLTSVISNVSGASGLAVRKAGDLFSLGDFLADPNQFFSRIIPTQVNSLTTYISTMSGSRLGWLEISIPKYIWFTFLLLALMAAFTKKDEKPLAVGDRVWFLLIAGITYMLILFAFFISWTNKDLWIIEGIQGRYLTPFLPLGLLIFKMKSLSMKWLNDIWLLFIGAVLDGGALYISYTYIMMR
jgi:uncharacterized membrane protein